MTTRRRCSGSDDQSRKPSEGEGSLRCVAARPGERDEEEIGRHFGRDDRGLLVAVMGGNTGPGAAIGGLNGDG
jgi:hypothetical protein